MRHPKELEEIIKNLINGRTNKEVSIALQEYGYELSDEQVRTYLNNHKIKRLVRGTPKYELKVFFPDDVTEFILENYHHIGAQRMARLVNDKFGTDYNRARIELFYKRYNIKSDSDGRFQKGCEPWCKGKKNPMKSNSGWFRKGEANNAMPIGTIRKRADDFMWIKVEEPNKWMQLARYVWEKEKGVKLTADENVIYKDGDRSNCNIENLMAVRKEEMNYGKIGKTRKLKNADMTELAVLIGRIERKVKNDRKPNKG